MVECLPPEPPPHFWSLQSPPLHDHSCTECGSHWLRPGLCCGRRTRRRPAPYYVALGSGPGITEPEFSVVLLTRNHLALTRTAVESLLRARGDHTLEFVIVDCCSTDGSLNYFRDLARREAVQLVITHPEEPFVYARNCNRGAAAARGRFLLLSNNDIEVRDPQALDKLARALSDPRVGVVGTRTDYECSNELQMEPGLPAECVWSLKPVMGFFWGMRAEVFHELGGMDEEYRGYGFDETDFEYRAIHRNYRLAVIDTLVHHERHATFPDLPADDPARDADRNGRRFYTKHGLPVPDGVDRYAYRPFVNYPYPQISVAIAARNYGAYLPRALDSALNGYLPNDVARQVVVVNDASADRTIATLEEYRLQHPEILSVIHRPVSRGPAAAKNHAIARCIGDYVALLDADDEFLTYKLWRSLETLEAAGADFLYHDWIAVYPDGRHVHDSVGPWSLSRWRKGRSLLPSTWVFRNGLIRFCEQYPAGEDPEFMRRHWSSLRSVYLPEALTRYHLHGTGLATRAACKAITGQLKNWPTANVTFCSEIRLSLSDVAAH
jgi:glycosyltransferase involved in cell wall biosynthesis